MRHFARAALAAGTFLVLVGGLTVAAHCAEAATPGEHLWHDWVFTSDVFEDEEAAAVSVDSAGRPIIVGTAVSTPGADTDIRYVSYEANSASWRWNAVPVVWDGAAGGDDRPVGVVTDAAGDAYIAGTTTVAGGTTDIVVLKILGTDPSGPLSGDLLWARQYDSIAGGSDEAEAIARDAAGNVYVTGGSQRADGSWDVITVKYRPNGSRAWARRHNNGRQRFDRGFAIAVRGKNVYVAGVSRRAGHADDLVLIKYSVGGARTWVRYYDDPQHRSEGVTGIACTSSSVYVCGSGRYTAIKPGQAMLVKYSAAGSRAWVRWAGSKSGDDVWSDIAVDSKARPHLTGTFFRTATADDIATTVYYPNGNLQWRAWFSSSGSRLDTGQALALDASRRTYVCGSVADSGGDSDMAVLCYGAGGRRHWFSRFPDPASYPGEPNLGEDRAHDIALVGGAAYVAGATTVYHSLSGGGYGGTTLDFMTLKLAR